MLHEKEKLFSKSVSVTIKDGSSNQCRNSKLLLTVEWQEASNALHRQELLITLTDNNDPFFLHHLQLSEEDFQMLKSSQGLLVDFAAFPQKFIDLIEVCLAEENKTQPKFLLIFNLTDKAGGFSCSSQLDVVETNPFKHLTHLSLKFVPATESSLHQYLTVCFKSLKDENRQLHSRLGQLDHDLREQVSGSRMALDQKVQELETVRRELSVELSMKESKHSRELQEQRETFLRKQKEEESRLEKERKEREQSFRKDIQQLETQVSCLDKLNKEYQEQNHRRDSTIRELQSQVLSLEEETKRTKKSERHYQELSEALQNDNTSKDNQLVHQKALIEQLEKENAYKKQQMGRLEEQVEHFQKHERAVEVELQELKTKFHRSANRCDQLEEDIAKANDVIEKLQREIQSGYEKLKQKNILSSKQEMSISEKDKIIQMLQKELKDIKLDLRRKNNEVKHLSDSVTSLEEKIVAMEKDIKSRDSVIKYLNRQLTDRCIIPQYVPSSNLIISPPSAAQLVNMNSGGDAQPSSSTLDSDKSKARNPVSSSPHNERSPPSQVPADSAYASSPSCGPRSAGPVDFNANAQNFELDSAALSAAFGSGQVLKHSTAKKSIGGRGSSRKK